MNTPKKQLLPPFSFVLPFPFHVANYHFQKHWHHQIVFFALIFQLNATANQPCLIYHQIVFFTQHSSRSSSIISKLQLPTVVGSAIGSANKSWPKSATLFLYLKSETISFFIFYQKLSSWKFMFCHLLRLLSNMQV